MLGANEEKKKKLVKKKGDSYPDVSEENFFSHS